ncbi:MAG: hypothetical protein JWM46_555 [Candidatus Kaiserbacteria bacterium]|nr:hypothetical protein [Candidatus Kaiserbacteria bacterium]
MNVADIPASSDIGSSRLMAKLAVMLNTAVDGKRFTHSAPIEGMRVSGRIFSVGAHHDMVPFHQPNSAEDVADELMALTDQDGARYDPASGNIGEYRGWRIATTFLEGNPAAIAWATWCSND